jgi:hypothetical protein
MKTTSYEISKQLAEAGFITNEENQIWNYKDQERWSVPAFDLETILEALPNFIANGNGTENCLVVDVAFGEIHYETASLGDCESDALFITTTRNNESLADTAARLLILLHEKGLINFNEEKQ